jgi:phosphomevalonate kinase
MKPSSWLLLLYQLPARPSTQRVYVWRRLKAIGALYLQHSACLLPASPDLRRHLSALNGEIVSRKGEALVLTIQLTDSQETRGVVERFRSQSDEDYREFLGKCRDFHAELEHERKSRHFTFAELEENEEELAKLRAWLPKITDRDFFAAKTADEASRALRACERDFEKFNTQVAAAQGIEKESQTQKPKRKRG